MLWMSADIYSRRPYSVPVCEKNLILTVWEMCSSIFSKVTCNYASEECL
jgi:hypothetical protein